MGLAAGRLRERIAIQRKNEVDNGRGGRRVPDGQDPWVAVATGVWAEVKALRGDEALSHSIVRSLQIWRVVIRLRSDVTTDCRFMWDSPELGPIIMQVKAIGLTDERDGLVMTCESGVKS